jgi:hypothetical protein
LVLLKGVRLFTEAKANVEKGNIDKEIADTTSIAFRGKIFTSNTCSLPRSAHHSKISRLPHRAQKHQVFKAY